MAVGLLTLLESPSLAGAGSPNRPAVLRLTLPLRVTGELGMLSLLRLHTAQVGPSSVI